MMDDIEIKHEFSIDDVLCPVCLSVGRKMLPLGQYGKLYNILTSQNDDTISEKTKEVELCWECLAILRRATHFQKMVAKASGLLYLGQAHIHGTLSYLTSIVINDTHPNTVYVNEHTHHTLRDNDVSNDDVENDVLINDVNDSNSVETAKRVTKTTKPSRWAIKRASQNKKKKFAILTDKKYVDFFNVMRIATEELRERLASERDGEHFKSKRFKCFDCVKIFLNERELRKHEHLHSKMQGEFMCDICNMMFKSKSKVVEHLERHYVKYECKLCGYICFDKSLSKSHFGVTHRKIFECVKCKLVYGTRKEFYHHHKSHHEKFICDHCGVSFKMKYCIRDHIRKKHSPYECKACGKRFARYNGLWLHNKTRHGGPTRGAYCVECDRHYADAFRYKWHLANSVRHRPRKKMRIPCPGCEKTFTKKIYMKDHYDLVHLKNYKYRCEECDKNFVRNAELTQHIRRVHQGLLPPRNKMCYVCGKGFTTNRVLANHVRTHSGSRPFACATCDARFTQPTALASHVRSVHRART